jgi:hypothetical protein
LNNESTRAADGLGQRFAAAARFSSFLKITLPLVLRESHPG